MSLLKELNENPKVVINNEEYIEYLFAKSQEIWRNHVGNVSDMIKLCEEKTGIDVKGY